MQPYLLAFCERKPDGLTRSVLTAVARVGPHRTLFATCKHVITQVNQIFVLDENGAALPESKWAVIPVGKPDLDLAFLFLRHDVPSDRIRINDSPIPKGMQLSHARNKFGETVTPSPFVIHSASPKHSPLRAELGWSESDNVMRYRFLNGDDVREAKREGVQTFYRVLEMESWTGVSGSALWDKFGAIRGIVCGGDSEKSRLADGIPRLVYVPAKTIAKEAKLILKNPELRARMQRD